jgi:S1-C subfamily serine protease
MLKKLIIALAIALVANIPIRGSAQQLIGSYIALLSEADHFNSRGQRLTSAAAIIRQNRANFHRFGIRSPEDQDDPLFANEANRAALEQMLERGRADPGVVERIVNGPPVLVRVDIFRGQSGPFIRVTLLNNMQPAQQPSNAANQSQTQPPAAAPATQLVNVTGTGFIISNAGHIVTNNHVVKDCVGTIGGNFVGEAAAPLRIVSADESNDLALLQMHGSFTQTAVLRSNGVHSGDSVVAIGFPFHGLLTSDLTVTTGVVNSLSGILNDSRFMQISAPVQPRNSGGPLLDMSGHIVGVVAEKLDALKVAKATGSIPENINFAIKAGALRDFLDNNVVSYRTADSTSELKASEIASAARAYTVLISCLAKQAQSEER